MRKVLTSLAVLLPGVLAAQATDSLSTLESRCIELTQQLVDIQTNKNCEQAAAFLPQLDAEGRPVFSKNLDLTTDIGKADLEKFCDDLPRLFGKPGRLEIKTAHSLQYRGWDVVKVDAELFPEKGEARPVVIVWKVAPELPLGFVLLDIDWR